MATPDKATFMIRFEKHINVFSLFSILSLFVWVFLFLNKGFDLTDEGYYLNSISEPWSYRWSTTKFGFVYHFIYKGLNSSLVLLRAFNLSFTLFLSLFCLLRINRYLDLEKENWSIEKLIRILSLSSLGLLSLLPVGAWLPTPSYNTLCFQGMLISLCAIIEITFKKNQQRLTPWIFLGLGGWLVFMAKPSSALLLGFFTLAYLFLLKKAFIKQLAVAIVTSLGLVLLSAIMIDGGVLIFFQRMQEAGDQVYALSQHSLWNGIRLDSFRPGTGFLVAAMLLTAIFLFIQKKKESLREIDLGMSILTSLFIFLVISNAFNLILFRPRTMGFLALVLPLNLFFYTLRERKKHSQGSTLASRNFLFFGYALSLSYAYIFGSSVNIWEGMTSSVLFGTVGSLTLIETLKTNKIQPSYQFLSRVTLLFSVIFINTGFLKPYRHSSLKSDLVVSNFRHKLFISPSVKSYLQGFDEQLEAMSFQDNTPMWDASGHSPGALYLMNAKAISQPWVIGGYPGSQEVAKQALEIVSCNVLAKTWILYEPKGPRRLDLSEAGILDIDTSEYQMSQPFNRSPYDQTTCLEGCDQFLLKPSVKNKVFLRDCSTDS